MADVLESVSVEVTSAAGEPESAPPLRLQTSLSLLSAQPSTPRESKSAMTRTLHISVTHSFDISTEASQDEVIQSVLTALAGQSPSDFELRLKSGAPLELKDASTPAHAWMYRKGIKPSASYTRRDTFFSSVEPTTQGKSEVEEVLEQNEDLKMKHLTLKLHKLAEGYSHRNENVLTGTQVVEFLIQERHAQDAQRAVSVGRRLFKLGILVPTAREVREFDNKNWFYRVAQLQDSTSSDATLWQYLANQPYQERGHAANPLLECLLQGKLAELPQLIESSPPTSLIVVLPALLVVLPASPFWVLGQVTACVDAIKAKAEESKDLRQFMQFLRLSGWVTSPIFEKVASASKIRAQVLEAFQGTLSGLGSALGFVPLPPGCELVHPFQRGTRCDMIQVLEVFKTNARPCLIDFATQEIIPASGNAIEPSISRVTSGTLAICKKGDDLRTDLGCLQVFKLFNFLWKTAGLGFGGVAVQAREYGVVPVGPNIGLIEFVFGCLSLTKIEMLRDKIKTTETLVNLISSAAGAFIGSYVLGVRDRHSDNIIIHKTNGYLFHIDFGHVLGDTVTIDTGPFPITPELKAMIGPVVWPHFVNLCGEAFLVLRKQFTLVCNYAELMLSSVASAEKVRAFMKQVFMLDAQPKAAVAIIKDMIEQAPSNYKTRLKNALHGMVVGNK